MQTDSMLKKKEAIDWRTMW